MSTRSTIPIKQKSLERGRLKYKLLKKQVKKMIFMNAAYCDQVHDDQEKLKRMMEERRFLLRRCMQFELASRRPKSTSSVASKTAPTSTSTSSVRSPPLTTPTTTSSTPHSNMLRKLAANVQQQTVPKNTDAVDKSIKVTDKTKGTDKPPGEKTKKRRPPPVVNRRLVQPIPVDATGRPRFPIKLNSLSIQTLGDILPDRPAFHTPDYIYPGGFLSTRVYAAMDNPEKKCVYTCKIVQADDGGPKFEIWPEDRPDFVITGLTATECHQRLLKIINRTCEHEILNTKKQRGAEFFGFSHPTVQNLIQNSAGARQCPRYKWIEFEHHKGEGEVPPFMEHVVALNFDALQRYPPFKGAMGKRSNQTNDT